MVQSLDNAPGEVMDKAARRMKLRNIPDYSKVSGGRAIELAAMKSKKPEMFQFTIPLIRNRDCNFSFSGLKDALVRIVLKKEEEHGIMGSGIIPEVYDLCAAFQLTMAEHIYHRTERAVLFCEKTNLLSSQYKNIVVSGGVACNDFMFNSLKLLGDKLGYNVYRPPLKVCTDNGIMIAWNGIEKLRQQEDTNITTSIQLQDIEPTAPLGTNIIDKVIAANLPTKVTRLLKLFNGNKLLEK
ncbi:probable tRNA N6-adenosine threonylcarbamoyltransferase, mitochondrial [Hyposmocoma kahamanoa]|uniref:probable tRNA N6-adenosine threonylcarbamoyltransferase, mitochondrial n=1 Tax=Hyposmocoma kahamanoa TaxID=1477025 RepID=UPI000E6D9868|nr:probable tRNA N6-adenosine threonylcarbamoyltransferase, mitochondrial [Hyposmocoma kahamanoa]